MRQRVSCLRCKAHRDLTLSEACLVCGAWVYTRVVPNPVDLEEAAANLRVSSDV
jgi:rRNA maturation protein Nop10